MQMPLQGQKNEGEETTEFEPQMLHILILKYVAGKVCVDMTNAKRRNTYSGSNPHGKQRTTQSS